MDVDSRDRTGVSSIPATSKNGLVMKAQTRTLLEDHRCDVKVTAVALLRGRSAAMKSISTPGDLCLTGFQDGAAETRCVLRDPGGHVIELSEVGQPL